MENIKRKYLSNSVKEALEMLEKCKNFKTNPVFELENEKTALGMAIPKAAKIKISIKL